jgi:putative membrane protein
MRLAINALALMITALLVPNIYFVDRRPATVLLMAIALGVLNAVVKPIVHFVTLQLIFATYGAIIMLVNAVLLVLLSRLFPGIFAVSGVLWAILGGALIGLVSAVLESLLGVTPPILAEGFADRIRPKAGVEVLEQALASELSEAAAPAGVVSEPADRGGPAAGPADGSAGDEGPGADRASGGGKP